MLAGESILLKFESLSHKAWKEPTSLVYLPWKNMRKIFRFCISWYMYWKCFVDYKFNLEAVGANYLTVKGRKTEQLGHQNMWIFPVMKELYLKQREHWAYHPEERLVIGFWVQVAGDRVGPCVWRFVTFFLLIVFPSLLCNISNCTVFYSATPQQSFVGYVFQFYLFWYRCLQQTFYTYFVQYM